MSALLEGQRLHSSLQQMPQNVCFPLQSGNRLFKGQTFGIRMKVHVSKTLLAPVSRYRTVRKQVRRRAERAEEERGERRGQVSGVVHGRPAQEEAPAQPHHLHHLPAA